MPLEDRNTPVKQNQAAIKRVLKMLLYQRYLLKDKPPQLAALGRELDNKIHHYNHLLAKKIKEKENKKKRGNNG